MIFRRLYGEGPTHLVAVVFCLGLVLLVLTSIGIPALWNPDHRLQSIAVWFVGAAVIHDLIAFPLYAILDRGLIRALGTRVNYVRVPALGAALSFILFFPGIIKQGSDTYFSATGLTQEPYAARWALLTAAMFTASAVVYAMSRIVQLRRR